MQQQTGRWVRMARTGTFQASCSISPSFHNKQSTLLQLVTAAITMSRDSCSACAIFGQRLTDCSIVCPSVREKIALVLPRVSENPDSHDLLILKLETWVRGSEPQKSVPLNAFPLFSLEESWSKVGIEPRNRSKSRIEHRTFGFSASRATN